MCKDLILQGRRFRESSSAARAGLSSCRAAVAALGTGDQILRFDLLSLHRTSVALLLLNPNAATGIDSARILAQRGKWPQQGSLLCETCEWLLMIGGREATST